MIFRRVPERRLSCQLPASCSQAKGGNRALTTRTMVVLRDPQSSQNTSNFLEFILSFSQHLDVEPAPQRITPCTGVPPKPWRAAVHPACLPRGRLQTGRTDNRTL